MSPIDPGRRDDSAERPALVVGEADGRGDPLLELVQLSGDGDDEEGEDDESGSESEGDGD